jgi:4-amino-4-deoxy-L-arabinose transferase-like glycosyltransferase
MEPPAAPPGDALRRPRWRAALPLLAAIVVSLLLRALVADIPLERDEGEYAYIAQRWLLGELPYRDAFDQKPPGVFACYGVLFALGGRSPAAIHWGSHLFLVLAALALWRLLRDEAGARAAALAALALLAMALDAAVLGGTANTEVFALLPLCAGMLSAMRGTREGAARHWLAAGAWGGAALLCKQVTAPVVALWGLAALASAWRDGRGGRAGRALRRAGLVAGGVALVVAPVCAWFAWRGAWTPFWDAVVGHNLAYSAGVPWRLYPALLLAVLRPLAVHQAPALLAAGLGLLVARRRHGDAAALALLAWLLASLAAASVGGRFREHYLLLLLPPLAALAGLGIDALGARAPRPRALLLGCALIVVSWPLLADRPYWFAPSPLAASRHVYGFNPFPESVALARVVAARSSPEDRVFVFGSEPQLLYHAARRSASRYIFLYPLYSGAPDDAARQREVLAELLRRPPRFVVLVSTPASFLPAPGSPRILDEALAGWLPRDYVPRTATAVRENGGFRVVEATPRPDGAGLAFGIAPDEALSLRLLERRR